MDGQREEVRHPLQRLDRIVRMQRGQAQVAGLCEVVRVLHRLTVTDLADDDDIRRLTQGIA